MDEPCLWRAVVTQPLDRSCELPALGELDTETGEFWPESTFAMPRNRQNLSAYERNRAYLNIDGNHFLEFSHASGCDIDSDSRSVVAADFDRDGFQDLLVGSVGGGPLRLFRNTFPKDNHRVRIHLVGIKSNRKAIGSRVIAHIGNRKIVRDLFPANSCLGQAPPELYFGTGRATQIDRLVVRWPTGEKQEFSNLSANGTIIIAEGNPRAQTASGWRLPHVPR